MTRETDYDEVVFVVVPALIPFGYMVDLQLGRTESTADAATAAALDHHLVN